MFITAISWTLLSVAVLSFAVLLIRIVFVPLAVAHEIGDRWRRRTGRDGALTGNPSVSVVVPAYNEEAVLESCVNSILASGFPNLEVYIVDDGSTDETAALGQRLALNDEVVFVRQDNAGKGAALNNGFRQSSGEFLLFIDADSVFTPDTIPEMLRAFRNPRVGAVCGDDRPVNLNSVLTRFLALITYVGTGLVRRAFDVLHCVPVISGNSGAFRRQALLDVTEEHGPFREDTVGEDLELTWRLHRSPWQVTFAPHAIVLAESPSNLKALWKQRVRWARGLLQGLHHHRDALYKPRHLIFTLFLYFTLLTMVAFPLIQVTLSIVFATVAGITAINADPATVDWQIDWWGLLLATGLVLSTILLVISMVLSNALSALRHIWTLPLWPIYSYLISYTMVRALWLHANNRPNVWNKPNRTGVISNRQQTSLEAQDSASPRQQPDLTGASAPVDTPASR